MHRRLLWIALPLLFISVGRASELSVAERFASSEEDVPDFRKHVVPLLGRIGCNGRACHGSFQGQGGFQLSLFGYDFQADHAALTAGDKPRVDLQVPENSLILKKATSTIDHGGGELIEPGSWQFRLLQRWIAGGGKGVFETAPELNNLQVVPSEITFASSGETRQLKVVAHWSDGTSEDVTAITRFRTNDESISAVNEDGLVTAVGRGDTSIVAFYDSGVIPVPVLIPVSEMNGDQYPATPTPTKIDELVLAKLRKLGIVQSEVCTDAEFLRRVRLDMTGTIPSVAEVRAFLADVTPAKRAAKIDELLASPEYAAWWATKFSDYTGNNVDALRQNDGDGTLASQQWYSWLFHRLNENRPYDEIVEGIVLATGRKDGQSYEEYCAEVSAATAESNEHALAERGDMPHYWMRRNFRKPEDRVIGFAHAFLGIRLQCAQCHKHPFDQWTKDDFDSFQTFFTNVKYGVAPDAKKINKTMQEELGLADKKGGMLRREMVSLLKEGKVLPYPEVFVIPVKRRPASSSSEQNRKNKKQPAYGRLLGGEQVDLTDFRDPRAALMHWMRNDPEQYFARAIVNRVWSNYFNVGIVDPPDDLNLANPPSNPELLDYLTREFVNHGYDLKWLHREITHSRTYQLSWLPTSTNATDVRNFARAVPRRIPAEVAYDAIQLATTADQYPNAESFDLEQRAIGLRSIMPRNARNRAGAYALKVFGKPDRSEICDCERSMDPSLLQTIYMRNDAELLRLIDDEQGWIHSLRESNGRSSGDRADDKQTTADLEKDRQQIARLKQRIKRLQSENKEAEVARLKKRIERLRSSSAAQRDVSPQQNSKFDVEEAVREGYLRTLSRFPADDELQVALQHIAESDAGIEGIRDLMWALLNTKEFIVNH